MAYAEAVERGNLDFINVVVKENVDLGLMPPELRYFVKTRPCVDARKGAHDVINKIRYVQNRTLESALIPWDTKMALAHLIFTIET